MAEDSVTNGSKGVQAYRWITGIGVSLIAVLSYRVLVNVDDMARDVRGLQNQVTTLNATLASLAIQLANADRRNDSQDVKLNDIERRVWQLAPTRTP